MPRLEMRHDSLTDQQVPHRAAPNSPVMRQETCWHITQSTLLRPQAHLESLLDTLKNERDNEDQPTEDDGFFDEEREIDLDEAPPKR
jgi:hypothetical protein